MPLPKRRNTNYDSRDVKLLILASTEKDLEKASQSKL